jgi:hypothetical protein
MKTQLYPPSQQAAPVAIPVCSCGQDLDATVTRHCPRCGIRLNHATTLPLAA